jgi:hypothetical protein
MRRALAILLVAAACGRKDAAVDSAAGTAGATDSMPRVAPKPLHVTEQGIGGIHAGMTVAEARQALTRLDFKGQDSTGCVYPTIAGLPEGVMVMIDRGVVARVDVQRGDVPTTEGIRIGDDTTKLRAAYGARVSASPHKYTDGKYYTVVPEGDSLHRIIFETNNAGIVLRYRAGKLPQVGWVESCS